MKDPRIADSHTIEMRLPVKARARTERQHYLEHQQGEGSPQTIHLGVHPLILGRAGFADVVIKSAQASRQHAIVQQRNGEFQLIDNESRNGIYLNEIKINSAILRDGDLIQIAEDVFIYHEG